MDQNEIPPSAWSLCLYIGGGRREGKSYFLSPSRMRVRTSSFSSLLGFFFKVLTLSAAVVNSADGAIIVVVGRQFFD